jgi:hypothetical protein
MAAVVRQVQPPRWKQSMGQNEFPQHPLRMVWVYYIGGVTEDETCKLHARASWVRFGPAN